MAGPSPVAVLVSEALAVSLERLCIAWIVGCCLAFVAMLVLAAFGFLGEAETVADGRPPQKYYACLDPSTGTSTLSPWPQPRQVCF